MSLLADLTRVRMLRVCERQELSVAELCAVLQIPQSTASRHLKTLVDEGWMSSRREGTSRFYRLERARVEGPARKLWKLIESQVENQAAEGLAAGWLRDDDVRLERVLLERQSRSQAFFASGAENWDRVRGELFGANFDVAGLGGLLDPASVVADLGCGTGRMAERLAGFAQRVYAIDDSPAMIRAARGRLRRLENVDVHRGRLEDLPLDDELLDVAFVSLVLHHVPEPQRACQEIARVLKPCGRLVLLDMQRHDREEYRQQMGHVWLGFEPEQISEWLLAAGLQPVRHVALPPEPETKGPPLFLLTAQREAGRRRPGTKVSRKNDPKQTESLELT